MSKRRSFDLPNVPHHAAPIPQAAQIGNVVYSSAITGQDATTGTLPAEPEKQAALAFQHMRTLVEAAGGTTDDIVRVSVYLNDMGHRDAVNAEWIKMFPDEHDRPARHATQVSLARGLIIQMEFVAVLGG